MIRKYLGILFVVGLLIGLTTAQNSICYSNCREGFCTDTSPRNCTSCDRGRVNINGRCIAGSLQPVIIFLTQAPDNIPHHHR